MAKVAITEQYLTDIADAIRSKTGMSTATYYPSQMASAIMTISGSGGITPTGTISITENGIYNVTSYASADVSVPTGSTINNQNKTVNPSTSQQSITADSGYTGLGTVTVNAMPSLTLPTSVAASATSGYTKKATVSRSTSTQYINIGTGYNAAGAYYEISAVANGSATGPSSLSASSATVSTGTNTITLTKTGVTTTPTVSAGYVSSATASTATIALTASVTTKGATTYTPTTTSQTISSGTYLTGTQTISGDANLIAGNIKKNVSIFGVTGSYEASGGSPTIDSLNVTPSESEQTFNSSSVDGYKPVTVAAISSTYVGSGIPTKTGSNITQNTWTYSTNGTYGYATCNIAYDAGYYSTGGTKGFTKIIADIVDIPKQAATTITPTESSQTAVSKFTWTTGDITVGAISSTYVGSGITSRSSTDLTASGATVTVPAGYYASQATKSVSSGSATGPSSLSGTSATVSTGTNTLTLTKTGVTTTPTVSAGYVSSATASTATVTLTASVTTKAAATITPGTSNQTIASGTYLTGTQTISGDANLVAGNIISGKTIFGVAGSVVLQTVYTGSSAPSSSTGSNGDIYIQS